MDCYEPLHIATLSMQAAIALGNIGTDGAEEALRLDAQV